MARKKKQKSTPNRTTGRGLRGSSPAETARVIDENGLLIAPTITRGSKEPFLSGLPTIDRLSALSVEQLGSTLSRFGIVENWESQRQEATGYLQRMTKYPSGSRQFKNELERLLDMESKSGLTRAVRRAYHEYTLANTDSTGTLIRISEGDENTCDVCNDLGGEIGTIDHHRSIGLPGAQSCDGGDNCRCALVGYD